jgi:hypothetical protein
MEHEIRYLPDAYRKDSNGVLYKLLQLRKMARDDIEKDIRDVEESRDLNKAYGKTLDEYGKMIKQKRGLLNDTQYRYMLFAKIGQNIVKSDYKSLMRVIIQMFNAKQGDISMDDLVMTETEQPCVLRLSKFPVQVLIDAGFSSRQAVQMIEMLLPICVTLSADNFEGTFEFADSSDEYDEIAGFANIEQTIGGYFGLLLGEDDKIPVLPIG